ncbi:unnamed protein product [Orchesella dallaii]|uniref:Uncharacterized protein n=1 Tax=Orchesella dallaii TaxID=48710 RepID=A0ABP1RFG1_9HEXA
MLSNRVYFLLGLFLPLLPLLGVIPFSWDRKKKLISYSKHGRLLTRFNFILIFGMFLFPAIQTIRLSLTGGNINDVNTSYVRSIARLISLEIFSLLMFREDDGFSVINSLLILLRHINNVYLPNFDPNESKYSYLLEFVFLIIGGGVGLLALANLVVIILLPNSSSQLGSVLPSNTPSLIRFIVTYVYPCHCLIIIHVALYIIACVGFLYGVIVVPFVIFEFHVDRKKYLTLEELRKPYTLMKAFRMMQVMQDKLMHLVGIFLVPTQSFFGNLIVFCSYMIIKYRHEMNIATVGMMFVWSFMGFVSWGWILLVGGYLHLYRSRVLTSWKYHQWRTPQERRIMSKFRKSCKPIMIHYGKTYTIRRVSVLKFIRGFTKGILDALLTLD